MNRRYFYLIIIGLLLLSNIVLLYFAIQKPSGFNPDGPKNIIIKKLKFDEQQIISYQKLIDQHRKEIRENDAKILLLKKELYTFLNKENNYAEKDALTIEIGKIQKHVEDIHFNHFIDIKELCKPEQRTHFEKFSIELVDIFNHKKHSKPHLK